MGMVFASRRTCAAIEDLGPVLLLIFREDGYRQLACENDAEVGDVVVYKNGEGLVTHVGLVVKIEPVIETGGRDLTVMSKWGEHGEYFHAPPDVPPIYGNPAEYWTERTKPA